MCDESACNKAEQSSRQKKVVGLPLVVFFFSLDHCTSILAQAICERCGTICWAVDHEFLLLSLSCDFLEVLPHISIAEDLRTRRRSNRSQETRTKSTACSTNSTPRAHGSSES